jgi:hypothetical protein
MKWEVIVPSDRPADVRRLAGQIIDAFHDGFGLPWREDGWSVDQAAAMVERCDVVQVLTDGGVSNDGIEGYACYVCPHPAITDQGHLLWEDGICIRKPHQASGFSNVAFKIALAAAGKLGRNVRWIGGRTQNPVVMMRYSKWGNMFPLDASYKTDAGAALLAFLIENIREVGDPDAEARLDRKTGVIRRAYSEGKLGNYAIPNNPHVAKWESWLATNGFDRDRGDAVAIVAEHRDLT